MSKNFSVVNVFNNLEANRAEAKTTRLENLGITIDTCMCGDTEEYETEILGADEDYWVIVEQYGTDPEEAAKGHDKYVDFIKKGIRDFKCIQSDKIITIKSKSDLV